VLISQTSVDLLSAGSLALPFTMQHQTQTEWCWAAVSVSVSQYFNPSSAWTQCGLVNAELGQSTCCQDGSSPACNQPWYLDRALTRTGNLASFGSGASTFPALVQEIAAARPLGARIAWSGGGGHFVVLTGYSGSDRVGVDDPWYGHSDYNFSAFTSRYQGSGSWTHSYFTKR
jgi:Papain-like cysteine protease AvrRpt2